MLPTLGSLSPLTVPKSPKLPEAQVSNCKMGVLGGAASDRDGRGPGQCCSSGIMAVVITNDERPKEGMREGKRPREALKLPFVAPGLPWPEPERWVGSLLIPGAKLPDRWGFLWPHPGVRAVCAFPRQTGLAGLRAEGGGGWGWTPGTLGRKGLGAWTPGSLVRMSQGTDSWVPWEGGGRGTRIPGS